jgi:hypothetical protein
MPIKIKSPVQATPIAPAQVSKRRKSTMPSKAKFKRMLDVASQAGMTIGGVELTPDGTLRILAERVVSAPLASHAMYSGTQPDEFAAWEQGGKL